MAEDIEFIRETTTRTGDSTQKTTEVKNQQDGVYRFQNLLARIVGFGAGVLMFLLGARFILALLGANTTNGFANFIYSTSHPFVAPFFSVFRYNNSTYGTSRFEAYTLVALVVYAFIAWGIVKLITINQD